MTTITLTDEQTEEVKGMMNASVIRMTEWIKEAKSRESMSEVRHLEGMRERRKLLQSEILKQINGEPT